MPVLEHHPKKTMTGVNFVKGAKCGTCNQPAELVARACAGYPQHYCGICFVKHARKHAGCGRCFGSLANAGWNQ